MCVWGGGGGGGGGGGAGGLGEGGLEYYEFKLKLKKTHFFLGGGWEGAKVSDFVSQRIQI